MKKITGLSETLKNLDGEDFIDDRGKPITAKNIIANTIARGNSTDETGKTLQEPARLMDIALRIYKADDEIELEDADHSVVVYLVKNDRLLNNISKSLSLRILQ